MPNLDSHYRDMPLGDQTDRLNPESKCDLAGFFSSTKQNNTDLPSVSSCLTKFSSGSIVDLRQLPLRSLTSQQQKIRSLNRVDITTAQS